MFFPQVFINIFIGPIAGYLDEMHNIVEKEIYNSIESMRNKTVCRCCHTLTAWMPYQRYFFPSPHCHKELATDPKCWLSGYSLISTFAKTKEKAKKRCFVHRKPTMLKDLNDVFHLVKIRACCCIYQILNLYVCERFFSHLFSFLSPWFWSYEFYLECMCFITLMLF